MDCGVIDPICPRDGAGSKNTGRSGSAANRREWAGLPDRSSEAVVNNPCYPTSTDSHRRARCGRFRHAGTLPKPTGFASHLTPRNLPLSKMTRLRVARSAPTPLPVKTISKHMMFSGPKTQPLSTPRYFFHHHLSPVPESTESNPKTRNQNKTTYMKLAHCLIALALALFAVPLLQAQIPIKVVVVTTFENGDDITGNGEFQAWAANLPLPIVIHFPQGYHHLRYNPDLGVLGIVTGQGKSHAAASIMGLGMDPRFDLTHAYWIVAAIAGDDPNKASVASAAWANYVVDGDLAYEIDAREIPYSPPWSTGYVPFGDSTPYALPYQPFNANGVNQVYQLNTSLVNWAYDLTKGITLPDDSTLMQVRAGYSAYPNAVKPPFVLIGDDLAADRFWFGDLFNTWAENWIAHVLSRRCRCFTSPTVFDLGRSRRQYPRTGLAFR